MKKKPEVNFKVTEVKVESKSRPLRELAQEVIEDLRKKLSEPHELLNLPVPTLEERISRMENMYRNDIPLVLQHGILDNIISLKARKIKQDHCE